METDIAKRMELLASEVEWELPIHVSGLLNDGAAEIRSLREAVRVLGEEAMAWRDHKSLNAVSLIDAPIVRAKRNTNANPIASAAVEAARNQTKGPES